MTLSNGYKQIVSRARELAAIRSVDGFCQRSGETDRELALISALGEAQELLLALATIAERLAGAGDVVAEAGQMSEPSASPGPTR